MTTRTVLIERAARAMHDGAPALLNALWRALPWDDTNEEARESWLKFAERALDALVPPGEAWIAPWTITDEQADLALSVTASHLDIKGTQLTVNREKMKRRFDRLRERLAQPDTDNGS